jgi:hypothetical protein
LQTFIQLAVELFAPRFVVSLQTKIERHREPVLRLKSGVHRLQLLQGANDESRRDQHHE